MSESTTTDVTLGGIKYEVEVTQGAPGEQVSVTIKEVKATVDYYVIEAIDPSGKVYATNYKRFHDGAEEAFASYKRAYPGKTVVLWVVQVSKSLSYRSDFQARRNEAARFMQDNIAEAVQQEIHRGRGVVGDERTIDGRKYMVTESSRSSWEGGMWVTRLVPVDTAGSGEYVEFREKIVDPCQVERKPKPVF